MSYSSRVLAYGLHEPLWAAARVARAWRGGHAAAARRAAGARIDRRGGAAAVNVWVRQKSRHHAS
jgi:hypothetical protein